MQPTLDTDCLRVARGDAFAGEAFGTRWSLPRTLWNAADPVLLLNYHLGQLAPGPARGFRLHPHLGFESYTFVLAGEIEHQDSAGHSQHLGPGAIQRIRFGDDYQHAARLSEGFAVTGGRTEGFQIWINLPADAKLGRPASWEFASAEALPTLAAPGLTIRLLVGAALGATAPLHPEVPIDALLLQLEPGAAWVDWPGHGQITGCVYRGQGRVGAQQLQTGDYLVCPPQTPLQLRAGDTGLSLLLVSGQPQREPLIRRGPFILTSEAQMRAAEQRWAATLAGGADA